MGLLAVAAACGRAESGDVVLMGGGATIASTLDAGLVDELVPHLAPVLLGSGTPLFTGPRSVEQRRRRDAERDAPLPVSNV